MHIVWNSRAKRNLRDIKAYYLKAGASPERVEGLIDGIVSATSPLTHSPRIGRKVPEIGDPDFREVLWKDWRIIYLLTKQGGGIEILNVLHSAQQFGAGNP
jgi:plasmid stabilization system protein ParE